MATTVTFTAHLAPIPEDEGNGLRLTIIKDVAGGVSGPELHEEFTIRGTELADIVAVLGRRGYSVGAWTAMLSPYQGMTLEAPVRRIF